MYDMIDEKGATVGQLSKNINFGIAHAEKHL
jgi:hypothetical protein